MSDVYQNLAKYLDRLPGGFPATESGVEIRILKHLFSPEEAELTVCLNIIPEAPEAIAARTGMDAEAIATMLEEMSRKGLIYRSGKGNTNSKIWLPLPAWVFFTSGFTVYKTCPRRP